jgi:hypothetical protein
MYARPWCRYRILPLDPGRIRNRTNPASNSRIRARIRHINYFPIHFLYFPYLVPPDPGRLQPQPLGRLYLLYTNLLNCRYRFIYGYKAEIKYIIATLCLPSCNSPPIHLDRSSMEPALDSSSSVSESTSSAAAISWSVRSVVPLLLLVCLASEQEKQM